MSSTFQKHYPAALCRGALFMGCAIGILFLQTLPTVAGQIRRLELTEDHPGTVVLALGRSTAISFTSRPQKVVPGSPQALQINFLGSDLTITPITRNPGNLLVYTKSSRYVILFRIANDSNYDDVVKVTAGNNGRPVHLLIDSYRTIELRVERKDKGATAASGGDTPIAALLSSSELEITGSELKDWLGPGGPYHCKGCVQSVTGETARMSCTAPIAEIHCESKASRLTIRRVSP